MNFNLLQYDQDEFDGQSPSRYGAPPLTPKSGLYSSDYYLGKCSHRIKFIRSDTLNNFVLFDSVLPFSYHTNLDFPNDFSNKPLPSNFLSEAFF